MEEIAQDCKAGLPIHRIGLLGGQRLVSAQGPQQGELGWQDAAAGLLRSGGAGRDDAPVGGGEPAGRLRRSCRCRGGAGLRVCRVALRARVQDRSQAEQVEAAHQAAEELCGRFGALRELVQGLEEVVEGRGGLRAGRSGQLGQLGGQPGHGQAVGVGRQPAHAVEQPRAVEVQQLGAVRPAELELDQGPGVEHAHPAAGGLVGALGQQRHDAAAGGQDAQRQRGLRVGPAPEHDGRRGLPPHAGPLSAPGSARVTRTLWMRRSSASTTSSTTPSTCTDSPSVGMWPKRSKSRPARVS